MKPRRTSPAMDDIALGTARRRLVRWSVALLGSAGVLWFGTYVLGTRPVASVVLALGCSGLALVGLVQLWRAARGASPLAVVTAVLVTGAVGCFATGFLLQLREPHLVAIGLLLLAAGGICGAIVASTVPALPAPSVPGLMPGSERRPVGAMIAGSTISLTALLVLGAIELLVWGPLAQTEGLALSEIYAGLSAFDRQYGVLLILLWLAFWSLAVAAFAIATTIAARRRVASRRRVLTIALGLAAAIVFFQFWAGFSLGMSIADTLPPYGGGMSPFGRLYALTGQLALVAAIFLGIAPRRKVGPAGIEPTTSTV